MNLFSRTRTAGRKPTSKRGHRDLAKALSNAPTRASREELLLLRNR